MSEEDRAKRASDLYHEGQKLLYSGKSREALKFYNKSLEFDPNRSVTWFQKAQAFEQLKEWKAAAESYAEARKKGFTLERRGEMWFREGVCFGNAQNYQAAIDCYDRALAEDPQDYHALNFKGVDLYKSKKFQEAIDCFDKAITVDPNNKSAFKNKGNALSLLKRYEEAIIEYDKALTIDANYSAAWVNKGNSLYGLADENKLRFVEAIQCYEKAEKAITSDPRDRERLLATVFLNRGQARFSLNDFFGALGDFSHPVHPSYEWRRHNNIGLCYYQLGLYRDAEAEFRNAITAAPKMVQPYYNLAVLYNAENLTDQAKKLLKSCSRADNTFTLARDALRKMRPAGPRDWYHWWFSGERTKSLLGAVLLVVILSIVSLAAFVFLINNNLTTRLDSSNVTLLTAALGLLVAILLLPSLKKVSIGEVEFEVAPLSAEIYVELELFLPMTGE